MNHRRGVIEVRMAVMKSIKAHKPTKSALSGIEYIPYTRTKAILADLERNKFIMYTNNHLYLTVRGNNILAKYNKLVKDLNVGTID